MKSVVSGNNIIPEKSMKGQKLIQTFIWNNILPTECSEIRREPGTGLMVLGKEAESRPRMAVTTFSQL